MAPASKQSIGSPALMERLKAREARERQKIPALREFPLAWRWTDPNCALFADEILALITPQSKESAGCLWGESLKSLDARGLDRVIFSMKELATEQLDPPVVAAWLMEQYPEEDTQVFVSWTPDLAILLPWGIFTKYWSEFCYPGADDVNVFARGQTWQVFYHHKEYMQFGIQALAIGAEP